ncbi:MAG TPA: GGDEF domain-containing protein [Acidimicrobiales bacterium]|nr:GGDEF domain-containing protein [Acidimicrobiales bacterium]
MSADDAEEQGPYGPDYFQRIVEEAQAATIVLDRGGQIRFASRAVHDMAGIEVEDLTGHNFAEFVHPDDLGEAVDTFAAALDDSTRWPPTLIRVVKPDGSAIPVEVIGHGMFDDPVVDGVIFSLHRMDETDCLHRILEAMATGAPLAAILRLVTEMVELPPLDLDAVVAYGRTGDGDALSDGYRLYAAGRTAPEVLDAIRANEVDLPWNYADGPPASPADRDRVQLVDVQELPSWVRGVLADEGYVECRMLPLFDGRGAAGALLALVRTDTGPGALGQRLRRARDVCELAFIRNDYEEQLRFAALHDRLTGLPNRARFFAALERKRDPDMGPLTAVLYLDLDGFKPINDRYGHLFGDDVLVEAAQRINQTLRPHDLAARLGGDEFAILVDGFNKVEDAAELAERLCEALALPMVIHDTEVGVSASIGVAVGPMSIDRSSLLEAADEAMYRAKHAGKHAVQVAEIDLS